MAKPTEENNMIKVGNEYYIPDAKDGRTFFKKIPLKEVRDRNKKAVEMAKKLAEHLNAEAVVKEAVMHLPKKDFYMLYKALFKSKKKYKPRTRERHCVDMKIGNFILPLIT